MAMAMLLGACTGSLLQSDLPVNSVYVLAPAAHKPALDAEDVRAAAAAASVDLSIGRPHLAPGLDTDRIAVLKGRRLDYYRAVRWGAPAGEVVQSLLVDSLQDQRLFKNVSSERSRVGSAYLLDIDVRAFQAEYAGELAVPVAHVQLACRLIRIADRSLVGTFTAQARQQASENRLSAVIAAFESAGQQVALSLARQAAIFIDGDRRAAPGEPQS